MHIEIYYSRGRSAVFVFCNDEDIKKSCTAVAMLHTSHSNYLSVLLVAGIGGALPMEPWYIGGPVVKGFGRGSKVLGIPTGRSLYVAACQCCCILFRIIEVAILSCDGLHKLFKLDAHSSLSCHLKSGVCNQVFCLRVLYYIMDNSVLIVTDCNMVENIVLISLLVETVMVNKLSRRWYLSSP